MTQFTDLVSDGGMDPRNAQVRMSADRPNFVEQLPQEEFVNMLRTLIQCEREFYGNVGRTTVVHLLWYLTWRQKGGRAGGIPHSHRPMEFQPFAAEQLRELRVSGIMALTYLRATKEMYEDIHGYP